ncbi:hypothetical protein [Pedobacter sp. PACM 27299]|nr:hypothetical protein [Pedobacter sp. PACM 27299]
MKNKIDEMLSTYGLNVESSILPLLADIAYLFGSEKGRLHYWN